jgi:hypothetical protein
MQANTLNILIGICGLALVVWGISTSANMKAQAEYFESTLESIDGKIQTQNDLIAGKAFYMPGTACTIRTSVEQTPEDILSFANACATAHREWLTNREIEEEIAEMESESR